MREWEGRECYKWTTAEVVANLMRFLHLAPKNGSDAQSAGRSKAKKSVDESDNKSNDEVIKPPLYGPSPLKTLEQTLPPGHRLKLLPASRVAHLDTV